MEPFEGVLFPAVSFSDENCSDNNKMPIKKEVVPVGTTIHKERPFVYSLSSKYRTECCDFCLKKATELLKCSNCKYVYYCGRACQKQAWAVHKQECKNLKQINPRILPDAARILSRLIRKLDKGGATVKGYYTEKNYRIWKDLMSHHEELKNDKRRMEHMSSLYVVLTEFQQEGLPNFAEFMGLYGRMCVNSFNICNQEQQSLGVGIYLAASIIDHSCQPNALATFEGTTLILRTLETLPELDWSNVRISYIDVMATTKERQKDLLETYYFLCQCPKCLAPENLAEMFGAQCPNACCDNYIGINDNEAVCAKCNTVATQEFINEFKKVVDITEMHISNMNNNTYLDVCKVCLAKQKNVLYKYHLRHIKTLDLAFEGAIDLQDFDSALEYGLELIDSYHKYYPTVHPLTGLLHLKLCKLLLFKNRTKEGISHLKKASDILKITHGITNSVYKTEVLPLIQQCRIGLNINGLK